MACGSRVAPPGHIRVFPPDTLDAAHRKALDELLAEPLPRRRLRANPRVVKRKMSNYGVKRPEHRAWPQPTARPADAVRVIAPVADTVTAAP